MKLPKSLIAAVSTVAFASTTFATIPQGPANYSNCSMSDDDRNYCSGKVCDWIQHDRQCSDNGQDELNKCWDHFCKEDPKHFHGSCPFNFKGKTKELLLLRLLIALLLDELHEHHVSPCA